MEGLADTVRSVLIFSGLSREDVAKVLGKMEELSLIHISEPTRP